MRSPLRDKQQILDQERVEAFLDELTMLTRKYGIEISSEGSIDVPSLRNIRHEDVNSSRYTLFWSTLFSDGPQERGPLDFILEYRAELVNEINLEDI